MSVSGTYVSPTSEEWMAGTPAKLSGCGRVRISSSFSCRQMSSMVLLSPPASRLQVTHTSVTYTKDIIYNINAPLINEAIIYNQTSIRKPSTYQDFIHSSPLYHSSLTLTSRYYHPSLYYCLVEISCIAEKSSITHRNIIYHSMENGTRT